MKSRVTFARFAVTVLALAVLVCAGCSTAPGRPAPNAALIAPDEIMDFNVLYATNCAGCHGESGKGGAAIALNDPVFLAIADDAVLRRTASTGVPGTSMPAFAQSAGGMLTDKQVEIIVDGIRSWAKPDSLQGVSLPPYAAQPGNPQRGATAYAHYCASCHGLNGGGGSKAGSIINGSFLALVSDQNLRTIVIAGRPELGAPDWREDVPGEPMSPEEISDVVAWLAAQRPKLPGQPYAGMQPTGEGR